MIPDLIFITDSFERFNHQIFSGLLPTPRLILTRAKTFRGKLVYKISRSFLTTIYKDFEIRISSIFDLPREEWEDVMIHEMIHLHIAVTGIKDKSSHGPEFRKLMDSINRKHNRNIKISAKSSFKNNGSGLQDDKVKAHFICMAKFSDGRFGIAPVAKSRIFHLWDSFTNFKGVVSVKWIASTDLWFNSLPHIRTPKFYLIPENEVLTHLRGGKILERTKNSIRVVNRRCSPDELLP